jgi:hypothetical protein
MLCICRHRRHARAAQPFAAPASAVITSVVPLTRFLGAYPVGALVDGYVHWTPERIPIAVMVEVAPAGFAALSQVVHYPIAVAAGVSYVTDWFEVGLGGGALVGNEGPCNVERPGAARTCEQNTGATFNQLLRLGALDLLLGSLGDGLGALAHALRRLRLDARRAPPRGRPCAGSPPIVMPPVGVEEGVVEAALAG